MSCATQSVYLNIFDILNIRSVYDTIFVILFPPETAWGPPDELPRTAGSPWTTDWETLNYRFLEAIHFLHVWIIIFLKCIFLHSTVKWNIDWISKTFPKWQPTVSIFGALSVAAAQNGSLITDELKKREHDFKLLLRVFFPGVIYYHNQPTITSWNVAAFWYKYVVLCCTFTCLIRLLVNVCDHTDLLLRRLSDVEQFFR